jgi:hypothetical protein
MDSNRNDAEFVQDIVGCARCHGDGHKGLKFRKLTHPVEVLNGAEWVPGPTHWATCPTNGEPILLYFIDILEQVTGAQAD